MLYIKHRRIFVVLWARLKKAVVVSRFGCVQRALTTHEVMCGQIEQSKSPINLAPQRQPCSATRLFIDRPDCAHISGECVDFVESMTLVHIGPGKFIWPFWRRIYRFEQCGRGSRSGGVAPSTLTRRSERRAARLPAWWVLRLTISERGPSADLSYSFSLQSACPHRKSIQAALNLLLP